MRRGTFSQRHSVLFDITNEDIFVPLAAVAAKGARFHAFDSMLSENAVLGFEYGYSLESPNALVIWEAQYGDFANGGQVVIDEFIMSSETKWERANGLTMLLPHGLEGQGPDHSSARPERFLQLCAENNVQVTYPSTPAQYFHLLRRQVKQPFRKPLIVLTPKSMLRHPLCVSQTGGIHLRAGSGRFCRVSGNPEKIRRFCSAPERYMLNFWSESLEMDVTISTWSGSSSFTRCAKTCSGRRCTVTATAFVSPGCRKSRPTWGGGVSSVLISVNSSARSPDMWEERTPPPRRSASRRLHREEQERILEEAFNRITKL